VNRTEKWTSGAAYEGWVGRWSRLFADEFLPWLGVSPRKQWLDLCCGSGALSEAILDRCDPTSLTGIDESPAQIAYATKHRARSNADFQLGDAREIPFVSQSFDAAVCGLGLNFIVEADQAAREMRRVTRPGGTVAAYVLDYREGARFLREFWDVAIAVDREAIAFDQGRRFPLCTPEGLSKLFASADLEGVEVRALQIVTRFANFDDYWEPFLCDQGSAPTYLATRSERIRQDIRTQLRTHLPIQIDGSIELPARAWAVRGRTFR
jgi:SAM-dependent methyltransferase